MADVILVSLEGDEFPFSKFILAFHSETFRVRFTSGFADSKSTVIKMPFSAKVMNYVMGWMLRTVNNLPSPEIFFDVYSLVDQDSNSVRISSSSGAEPPNEDQYRFIKLIKVMTSLTILRNPILNQTQEIVELVVTNAFREKDAKIFYFDEFSGLIKKIMGPEQIIHLARTNLDKVEISTLLKMADDSGSHKKELRDIMVAKFRSGWVGPELLSVKDTVTDEFKKLRLAIMANFPLFLEGSDYSVSESNYKKALDDFNNPNWKPTIHRLCTIS